MSRAMKDSGIPWIGEIPEGWEVARTKRNYEIVLGKMLCSQQSEENPIKTPYICAANVHFDGVDTSDLKEMWFSSDELALYAVNEGDLLVVEGGAGAGGAAICPKMNRLVGIQNSILVARNKRYKDNRFLRYFVEAVVKQGYVDFVCNKATIPHFTKEKLGNMLLPLPPLSEQRAIADYLDEKCGAIDAAIAEAKKGIEEYKAWKKSLIFEAVTGKRRVGVFNAEKREAEKIKPSGIPWIGAIPEGWRVMKLRRLGTFANGISKGGEFFGKGSPFVSYSDVYKNEALPTVVKGLLLSTPEEQERYSVEKGDVFFTRTSETIDEIGFASTCLENISQATFAGFLIRFRPTGHDILPCFSKYYFRNKLVSEYFAKELVMVTRASLGQELLKSLPVLLPPIPEQRAIADYLDEKCAAIDAMVTEKEALIADLEAYKQSLIYEVVTGKKEPEAAASGTGQEVA